MAPPGARRQQRRATAATKAELLEKLAELQDEGDHPPPSALDMTVGEFLAAWVEDHGPPHCSPSTQVWRQTATTHYLATIADVPLQQLDRGRVKELYRHLADAGRVRGEGGLAETSVHRVHDTLHAALEDAVRDGLLARNPADEAHSLPRRNRAQVKAWTAEELREILETARADPLFALWRTAAWTGARRGELLALRWRDLSLGNATLTINRSLVKGVDGLHEQPPKSARGRRTIDLDDHTVRILAELHHATELDQADDPMFAHPRTGELLHPDAVTNRFERIVRGAGVRVMSLHVLRHTHATLLLANGTPLHVVSRRLGHSSETFTARVYAHVLPQQQRAAVTRLAEEIDGIL